MLHQDSHAAGTSCTRHQGYSHRLRHKHSMQQLAKHCQMRNDSTWSRMPVKVHYVCNVIFLNVHNRDTPSTEYFADDSAVSPTLNQSRTCWTVKSPSRTHRSQRLHFISLNWNACVLQSQHGFYDKVWADLHTAYTICCNAGFRMASAKYTA